MRRLALALCALLLILPLSAQAGLLSKLGRLGDDAGGAARKADGVGGSDIPASALRAAKDPNTTAMALHVDADGSIRLTDELGRAVDVPADTDLGAVLKKASGGSGKVAVVADTATIAKAGPVAHALAEAGSLKLWHGKKALPVRARQGELQVEIRDRVLVPLRPYGDRKVMNTRPLREAVYAMVKALNRGTVVVAQLGKPAGGPRMVGFGDGPSGKPGETLTVTRDDLLQGFRGNRGGTVVLAGRIEGDALRAPGGPVPLADIRAAAAGADVHLVLLDGPAKAAHKAIAGADTYGDLLTGLAPKRTPMVVEATATTPDRVRLSFQPEAPSVRAKDGQAPTVADDVTNVVGTLAEVGVHASVRAIQFDTRDRAEEQDRDLRLIPGIPFMTQFWLGLNLILGLYGSGLAWRTWRWIWPMRPRPQRIALAHIPRFLVFLLVLLPLTGFIWAIGTFFLKIGGVIMSVLRLIGLAPRQRA